VCFFIKKYRNRKKRRETITHNDLTIRKEKKREDINYIKLTMVVGG